jgi:metal-sulfur cluster biosynthetic enzyme
MNTLALDETTVRDALRQVVDPELDCNIVDLGLIYDISIRGGFVAVTMTLTTPGCPMHESISWGVEAAVRNLPGVQDASVEVVWDPPWNPAMMTETGRARLGVRGC